MTVLAMSACPLPSLQAKMKHMFWIKFIYVVKMLRCSPYVDIWRKRLSDNINF